VRVVGVPLAACIPTVAAILTLIGPTDAADAKLTEATTTTPLPSSKLSCGQAASERCGPRSGEREHSGDVWADNEDQ